MKGCACLVLWSGAVVGLASGMGVVVHGHCDEDLSTRSLHNITHRTLFVLVCRVGGRGVVYGHCDEDHSFRALHA